MSELEDAYVRGLSGGPEAQHAFYALLLRSVLLVPTWHVPPVAQPAHRADGSESFAPIILDHDGRRFLPVFDSLERLSAWATREVGYVGFPGHALLEMMDPDIHWILNPNSAHQKEFVPDELIWLKGLIATASGRPSVIPPGTRVLAGAPAAVPTGLIAALSTVLSRNPEVQHAWLGQVTYELPREVPHLALVIDADHLNDTLAGAIQKDLFIAAEPFLSPTTPLDLFLSVTAGVSQVIATTVSPFYSCPEQPPAVG